LILILLVINPAATLVY